ncbi:hypothetical protein BH20ACI3_BH20ACI3_25150 [soil metagenome]
MHSVQKLFSRSGRERELRSGRSDSDWFGTPNQGAWELFTSVLNLGLLSLVLHVTIICIELAHMLDRYPVRIQGLGTRL